MENRKEVCPSGQTQLDKNYRLEHENKSRDWGAARSRDQKNIEEVEVYAVVIREDWEEKEDDHMTGPVVQSRDCEKKEKLNFMTFEIGSEKGKMDMFGHKLALNKRERKLLRTDIPELEGEEIFVLTAFKKKAQKVKPLNSDKSDGSTTLITREWKLQAIQDAKDKGLDQPREPHDKFFIPKFSSIKKGSRLTEERKSKLIIGDFMTAEEKNLLTNMLFNREAALAWTFAEKGSLDTKVAPPQKIRVIPHEAWQQATFQPPRALRDITIDMLRQRIDGGVLENSHGPYRNPWFLVKKKNGKYRLINAAFDINRVTIRDANLPPNVEEFADEFAGLSCCSLIDLFSGYDQIPLDEKSRDLTGFMTPLGLLRYKTLPMGATNSVSQFVRIINGILQDHFPHRAMPFLDDIGVKGPRTSYNGEEAFPGVRRFVLEHLQWMDGVLADVERAGLTIAGEKSEFCMQGVKIVGYICDTDGKRPAASKIIKIVEWDMCRNQKDVRAFLGICVFYRTFIKEFAILANPLFHLLRKDVIFEWGKDQQDSMSSLQRILTSAPVLRPIDYCSEGKIILAVDASNKGWGSCLMQEDPETKKKHPSRYDSGIWNHTEQKYDAGKLECRALMKALKKVRSWLYGVHFHVEIDANTLVAQLNRSATDLPGSLVVRWLAWIRMFDFEVKHVPGKTHTVADGLSRKPPGPSDIWERDNEEDIDDWVDKQLNCVYAYPAEVFSEEEVLYPGYSEEHQEIAKFLLNGMQKPSHLKGSNWTKFRKEALKFVVRERHLFRRATKNVSIRRVLDKDEERAQVLKECHDNAGHPGKERTYRLIADRYWWKNVYEQIKKYVLSCHDCQTATKKKRDESVYPTFPVGLFQRINVDIVYMPDIFGFIYLVVGRDDFSGWVEARPLRNKESFQVAKFIYEDFICRHPCPQKIVVDGGTENQGLLTELVDKYGLKRSQISAYNPRANGQVERGHAPIVQALQKLRGNWVKNLPTVLYADRATVRRSTGLSPHRLVYGCEMTLQIELDIPTFAILPYNQVRSTADLLQVRARQLQKRDEDVVEALAHLQRSRQESAEYFNENNEIRIEIFEKGDLVLLWDSSIDTSFSRKHKFAFRWLGPYKIRDVVPEKGTYWIEELDGTMLSQTIAGSRLKKYLPRENASILQEVLDENIENASAATQGRESQAANEEYRRGLQPLPRRLQAVVIPVPRA